MKKKPQPRGGEVSVRNIGTCIRTRRTLLGMTLVQLGRLAEIDVSQLSKVERGESSAAPQTLDRILFELGLALRIVDRPHRRHPRLGGLPQ